MWNCRICWRSKWSEVFNRMGLAALSIVGYDSAGIAGVVDGEASVTKAVGRIKNLEALIPEDLHLELGIGHTRWATHVGLT